MASLPQYSQTIDLSVFVEPLGGPGNTKSYLDRFPDEIYTKSPDSHLARFMYVLLGPVGVGWLKKNLLDARLALEDAGFDLFDLEKFYGDPFSFGRILEEMYEEDPYGLLPRDQWDAIKAKDEAYRSRAVNYFNAARLGTSPQGMALAAQAGIGHAVEVIENYKYLFDVHSDHPIGLQYFGKTASTEEFIVVPRRETSRTEVQTLSFRDGNFDSGYFVLAFNGYGTDEIAYDAEAYEVQEALQALPSIGSNAVTVSGGPAPNDFVITFTGTLSNQDVPEIQAISQLMDSGANNVVREITVTTTVGGLDASDEVVMIPPVDQHGLIAALDYLRPVGSIPTIISGKGLRTAQNWSAALASSAYSEVVRFVSGSSDVNWPAVDKTHWIVAGEEVEAPRIKDDHQHHYVGFHNVSRTQSYTEEALDDANYSVDWDTASSYRSEHAGAYVEILPVMPFFSAYTDPSLVFTSDRSLADYAEPLTVTSIDDATKTKFINGIYPLDYSNLSGVQRVKYNDDQFWSSRDRSEGTDYLEIDLGEAQPVNFLTFETTRKPISLELSFDILDQNTERRFVNAVPIDQNRFTTNLYFDPMNFNPWETIEWHFSNGLHGLVFTRFIRIGITRRVGNLSSTEAPFLFNPITQVQSPWSVEVRNLRVGRYVV